MTTKNLGMFAIATVILVSSVAVASHLPPPPQIANGGDHAYVRDHPSDGLDALGASTGVTATYVSYDFDTEDGSADRITGHTSRGRLADQVVFDAIALPTGMLQGTHCFNAVQHIERGLLVAESDLGRVMLLNGVNAGLGIQAQETIALTLHAGDGYTIEMPSDDQVTLNRDGHHYQLDIHLGNLDVNGTTIHAILEPGGLLTGHIDSFPATTGVMLHTFTSTAGIPRLC